jgi:hypothetical protein
MAKLAAHYQFAHKFNRDGSVDSICPVCFETIATEGNEADLIAPEEIHRCPGIRAKALHPERPEHLRGVVRACAETAPRTVTLVSTANLNGVI